MQGYEETWDTHEIQPNTRRTVMADKKELSPRDLIERALENVRKGKFAPEINQGINPEVRGVPHNF